MSDGIEYNDFLNIAQAKERLEALEQRVEQLRPEPRIDELEGHTARAEENIAQLEADVGGLTLRLESYASQLEADVGSLQQAVTSLYIELRQAQMELIVLCRSPWWKKLWWAFNGWPIDRLADKPTHRFWHRWFGAKGYL